MALSLAEIPPLFLESWPSWWVFSRPVALAPPRPFFSSRKHREEAGGQPLPVLFISQDSGPHGHRQISPGSYTSRSFESGGTQRRSPQLRGLQCPHRPTGGGDGDLDSKFSSRILAKSLQTNPYSR